MLKRLARAFTLTSKRLEAPSAPATASDVAGAARDVGGILARAKAALDAGEARAVVAELEPLLEALPELAAGHLLIGRALRDCKSFEDARDHLLLAASYDPADWRALYYLALVEIDAGQHAEAIEPLERALARGANEAPVHNALGAALLHRDRVSEAVEAFRAALSIDLDYAPAHSNLGYTLIRDLERYDEGSEHLARAMTLAPNDEAVVCNWIMALYALYRYEEALPLADAMLERNPALSQVRLNRAFMLLSARDYPRGWTDYETRALGPREVYRCDAPLPVWNGERPQDRSIFVHAEQGLGDEIMFASCLPDLVSAARACTIECDPRLVAIFARSFPQAAVIPREGWKSTAWPLGTPDCKIAIGSLPRFYRQREADFPRHAGYLWADSARVQTWRARLGTLPGRLKVGISWRGGLPSTRRSRRTIPLDNWGSLLRVEGVDFISLQYTDPERELEALRDGSGPVVHEWPDAIRDYDETAALVSALDMVISVQTAVVHLAGALGKPAWVLIPAIPEWRYGSFGESMPWYPSVKLFRQNVIDQWSPVLEEVEAQLRERVASHGG